MAEYALVTSLVASLALAIGTIPDAQLALRLPTSVAKAQTLISSSARTQKLKPVDARAAMSRAPYPRAALRYLHAEGWIRGRRHAASCVFAKAAPGATTRSVTTAIRRDARLVARLSRMRVTVTQAAEALVGGTASAC